jgi:hypothetical protein
MLAIPLPIKHYLNPLLGAAEAAGFVGLVFVIARTPDAPQQHEELSEHWASVHDVTGPLIGVVWPSNTRNIQESAIPRAGSNGEAAALVGFRFTEARDQNSLFSKEFWNLVAQNPELTRALERNRGKGLVYSKAPIPKEDLGDAWSTATTDSAEYFGFDENRLPCLVILSLLEHTALVLPLGMIPSIYDLLRSTRIALGTTPGDITRVRDRREAIDTAVSRMNKTLGELDISRRARIQKLDRAINSASWLDRGVAAQVQLDLQQALSSWEPGGAPAALETLLQQLPPGGDQRPADRRKVKPLSRYAVNRLREILLETADLRHELEEAISDSHRLKTEEATLLAKLKLSQAVLAADTGNRGTPPIIEELGRGALTEWKVQYVGAPGRSAITTTKTFG